MVKPVVHFVGFRGDEYLSAVRVFGPPAFIHMTWDKRARRDVYDGDTVVFANKARPDAIEPRNSSDLKEVIPCQPDR